MQQSRTVYNRVEHGRCQWGYETLVQREADEGNSNVSVTLEAHENVRKRVAHVCFGAVDGTQRLKA